MGNSTALSLDRVFRAMGEVYGNTPQKDLRYFLGSFGWRDGETLTLTRKNDGAFTAPFSLRLSAGGPVGGILRFSNNGHLDAFITQSPSVRSNFYPLTPSEGQPKAEIIRTLIALAFGTEALPTPLEEEESLLIAGVKALYDNPTHYNRQADQVQRIANQVVFSIRMLQVAEEAGNADDFRDTFQRQIKMLDTLETNPASPDENIEERVLRSSIIVNTIIQTEAGAKACAQLGRCVAVTESPICSTGYFTSGRRDYYVYRGAEVFATGKPACFPGLEIKRGPLF